jgi:hypothetical protein
MMVDIFSFFVFWFVIAVLVVLLAAWISIRRSQYLDKKKKKHFG